MKWRVLIMDAAIIAASLGRYLKYGRSLLQEMYCTLRHSTLDRMKATKCVFSCTWMEMEVGKGTHLSFFLTLMRGEYDALLTWPFQQKVTLILQDQDQLKHIAKWFKPDLSDAGCINSFQRPSPHSDMNVAWGCPKFVPLSILDNPSYIKDGTMIFRCIVDTTATGT